MNNFKLVKAGTVEIEFVLILHVTLYEQSISGMQVAGLA
jgi:hypothetical protein